MHELVLNFCFPSDLRIQFSRMKSPFGNFRLGFSAPHGTYLWHQLLEWLTHASGGERAFWGYGKAAGLWFQVLGESIDQQTQGLLKMDNVTQRRYSYFPAASITQPFPFEYTFWLYCAASGILAPWPGIEPATVALECGVLTTGLLGKSSTI